MNKEEKIVRLIVKLFSGDISPKENEEVDDWTVFSMIFKNLNLQSPNSQNQGKMKLNEKFYNGRKWDPTKIQYQYNI